MGFRGVIRVCSASKVTRRIIWVLRALRYFSRTTTSLHVAGRGNRTSPFDGHLSFRRDGDLTLDNSRVRYHGGPYSRRHGQVQRGSFPRRGASPSTTSDAGGHTLLHERLRQFPLVQQYARLSPRSLLPELRCENENSFGQSAQVDIPLRRNGTLLDEMERVQVLHEHQGPSPRAKARRVDTAPRRVVGQAETGVEQ